MITLKLTIVHFHPIEKYPPLQNLINYTTEHHKNISVRLITTIVEQMNYTYSNSSVYIKRIKCPQGNPARTLYNFLKFTLVSIFELLLNKPDKLLYYESISSFPVFIYKLFNRKADTYIHYHEYTTKDQYKNEMRVIYFSHLFEKYLYKKAKWISHTNKKRLELFAEDNGLNIKDPRLNVLPNYPPKSWQSFAKQDKIIDPAHIRLVYVGSLSMVNMYTKELFDWIESQNGKITLGIYSINIYEDVKVYLNKIKSRFITILGGISYNKLPELLYQYDVGLILYKSVSQNYLFNASNKLFEYLALGLDVWYSEELDGIKQYSTIESIPKIIGLNFNSLKYFNYNNAIAKQGLHFRNNDYYCELVFTRLLKEINEIS